MKKRLGNICVKTRIVSVTERVDSCWIAGTMSVSAKHIHTGEPLLIDADIPVGCYSDWTTADQHWNINYEGARLLLTVFTGKPCRDRIPGGSLPEAMPLLCEEWGRYVARELHRHLLEATY